MLGKIIAFVSCFMCAVPFLIISIYNKEMAALYKKCAIAFLLTGVGFLVLPAVGVVLLCFDCTLGIYLMYREYKKILEKYS